MAWVLDHSEATGSQRLVLIAIANHLHYGDEGKGWSLSIARLAAEANVSESAARRAIRRLELSGEVRIDRTLGGAGKLNHFYLPKFSTTLSDREGSQSENPRESDQNPRESRQKPSRRREGNRSNRKNQNGSCPKCGAEVLDLIDKGTAFKSCSVCTWEAA